VSVDAAGKVWTANRQSNTATRIDAAAGPIGGGGSPIGAVDLVVNFPATTGRPLPFPYNYSDMTGAQLFSSTAPQGSWTVVQDSGSPGNQWGTITWNTEPQGSEPPGTSIAVEARAADTEAALGSQSYTTVSNGTPFVLLGRFIQVRATLKADSKGNSPVLSDIRIVGDPRIVASGTKFSTVEGQSSPTTVATFTDPDPKSTAGEYSATIDWGDGSSSPGSVGGPTGGPFTVLGGHAYAEEGTANVTVTIVDPDNASNRATVTSTATVADAALASVTPPTIQAGNPVNAVVAKFTDADPAGTVPDYTATINWGDGSPASPGSVSGPDGGPFSVTGTHTYPSGGPFSYTVKVHICDIGGSCVDTVTRLVLVHMTGDAYPARVTAPVVGTQTVAEAGPVDTTSASNTSSSVASLSGPVVSGSGLGAGVVTGVSPNQSSAQASAASLTVAATGLPVIKATVAQASSQTSCAGSSGTANIASLSVDGVAAASGYYAPNSTVTVPTVAGPVTVVLNQQTPVPGGLRVNAAHVSGPSGLDVVIASATSDIHNCP